MKRFLLLALTAGFLFPIAAKAEGLYDTQKEARDACVAWWKEGGEFYITEGEGYNMITRKIRLRRCFIDVEKKMMVGKELTKLESDKKYSDIEIPEIGKGIAIPETIKKYRYKE